MGQGLVHVLAEVQLVRGDQVVLLAHQEHQEALHGEVTWGKSTSTISEHQETLTLTVH